MLKIIDEKGMLFGKINIIDFMVILFIACLLPVIYFGYKMAAIRKPVPQEEERKEFMDVELNCLLVKLPPSLLRLISVGDKEADQSGKVIGEIIGLENPAPYLQEFDIGGGRKIVRPVADLRQMEAKLKLRTLVESDKIRYKDSEIAIGSPIYFVTGKYKVTVMPVIGPEKVLDLPVIFKDLDEHTLKMISIGDKETDGRGEAIAEIINLGRVEESSFEIHLGGGGIVSVKEKSRKQISAKMRLKCILGADNQIYFRGSPINLNNNYPGITFTTAEYTVRGVLTPNFDELNKKWVTVRVKFFGVLPEITNIIQIGDIEKDIFSDKIAELKEIIAVKPEEVLVVQRKELFSINHLFQKNIEAIVRISCLQKEGGLYFKNSPVKAGNNLIFSPEFYSISGIIVRMETE